MTPDQKFLAIGIYLNSSLYYAGVFIAGMVTGNQVAWKLALTGVGICYFLYVSQVLGSSRWTQLTLMWLSVVLGIAGGLALLFNLKA